MSGQQHAGRSHSMMTDDIFCRGGTVQIFGNNPNESKLYSGRN